MNPQATAAINDHSDRGGETWPKIAGVVAMGYLCFSRTFAYLGVPGLNLFVSEVVLALFLVAALKLDGNAWPWAAGRMAELKRLTLIYVLFLGYGFVQIAHGIVAGNPPFVAIRDLTFNYYPLYLFMGLWAGFKYPHMLPRLLRIFAWVNGIYGVSYLLVLNRVQWFVPGVSDGIAQVPIFGQPVYSFVALLALIAYEKNIWKVWHLLALNAFVMLGMQVRTEWLAFGIGMITWFVATRQTKKLMQAAAILAAGWALMYITDFTIPGPEGRGGGDISVRQLTDRALSPFHADVTDVNAAAGIGTETQESTFVWRTVWWLLIWTNVHSTMGTTVWGFGYGYPLGDLAPYLAGEFIRTPHNAFFYALGYTGWIGVILFFIFQGEIVRLLWRVNRSTGEPFGVPFWMAMMAYGMFFPLGETPYGAIPFYLIVGWAAAPILKGQPSYLRPDEPEWVTKWPWPAQTNSSGYPEQGMV